MPTRNVVGTCGAGRRWLTFCFRATPIMRRRNLTFRPMTWAAFLAGLGAVIAGSMMLSRALDRLGQILRLPEQFLGFVVALGADSPEISSSVVAMLSGRKDVGAGVVFGSNLFNLASLLGLAALISGNVRVGRASAWFNGAVAVLVTVLAGMLVLGLMPGLPLILAIIFAPIPYALLLWLGRDRLARLPLPDNWTAFLRSAMRSSKREERQIVCERENTEVSKSRPTLMVGIGLVLVIGGSIALVRSTTALTARWLPRALLGPLLLAALTGIPNLHAAISLALKHKGSAVLTEAMNSNTLNIVAGLAIPAWIFGDIKLGKQGTLEIAWLLLMTVGAIALAARRGGLSRTDGALILASYLIFVGVRVYLAI
jgi:cation:H+ antiporter